MRNKSLFRALEYIKVINRNVLKRSFWSKILRKNNDHNVELAGGTTVEGVDMVCGSILKTSMSTDLGVLVYIIYLQSDGLYSSAFGFENDSGIGSISLISKNLPLFRAVDSAEEHWCKLI